MGNAVLIIDDDEGIRRTFAKILQRNGYNTDVAQSGKEAIQKIRANHYTVALLDIYLPDINGIQLLSQIRSLDEKMVIIVITGDRIILEDGLANAFLLKPVQPSELLAVIEQKIADKQTK